MVSVFEHLLNLFPQAAASRRLFGRPSRRDGSTATWARCHRAAMSSTSPSQLLRLAAPRGDLELRMLAGLAGSGEPASSRRQSRLVARMILKAASRVRTPLSSSMRPTKAKVTGPSGSGIGRKRSVSMPERSRPWTDTWHLVGVAGGMGPGGVGFVGVAVVAGVELQPEAVAHEEAGMHHALVAQHPGRADGDKGEGGEEARRNQAPPTRRTLTIAIRRRKGSSETTEGLDRTAMP